MILSEPSIGQKTADFVYKKYLSGRGLNKWAEDEKINREVWNFVEKKFSSIQINLH